MHLYIPYTYIRIYADFESSLEREEADVVKYFYEATGL